MTMWQRLYYPTLQYNNDLIYQAILLTQSSNFMSDILQNWLANLLFQLFLLAFDNEIW